MPRPTLTLPAIAILLFQHVMKAQQPMIWTTSSIPTFLKFSEEQGDSSE